MYLLMPCAIMFWRAQKKILSSNNRFASVLYIFSYIQMILYNTNEASIPVQRALNLTTLILVFVKRS